MKYIRLTFLFSSLFLPFLRTDTTVSAGLLQSLPPPGSAAGQAGRQEGPFACRLCHKVFRDASNLSHHAAVHRGETTCPRCTAVLSTKRNLRYHLSTCRGPTLPPRRGVPPRSPLGPPQGLEGTDREGRPRWEVQPATLAGPSQVGRAEMVPLVGGDSLEGEDVIPVTWSQ